MAPYDVAMLVESHAGARDVRMVLTMDAMHDEARTRNMSMGWESELVRIGAALRPGQPRGHAGWRRGWSPRDCGT